MNDGNVTVVEDKPASWGGATAGAIKTVATATKGTKTEKGWTVIEGCCCIKAQPKKGSSDASGESAVPVESPTADTTIDEVLIFPRNKAVIDFNAPGAIGWTTSLWPGGDIAPVLPFETAGSVMFQDGILFTADSPAPGPATYDFSFALEGHESFLDIFIHEQQSGQWLPFVVTTQQLLGDMDGDGELTDTDLTAWDLAFNDPTEYASQYPLLDPIYGGDLDHDGGLTLVDLQVLTDIIQFEVVTDATPEERAGIGIPTVSEWGLIFMGLLVLTAGTIMYGRWRRVGATG